MKGKQTPVLFFLFIHLSTLLYRYIIYIYTIINLSYIGLRKWANEELFTKRMKSQNESLTQPFISR